MSCFDINYNNLIIRREPAKMDSALANPIRKTSAVKDDSAFCALCLRRRRSNGFFGYHIGANSKFRKSMDSVLGFQLHLDSFYTCKSCLKLVQLMQDFRSCCGEANEKLKRLGKGFTAEDKWFSGKTAQVIENIRCTVANHTEWLKGLEVVDASAVPVKQEPVEQEIPDQEQDFEIPDDFITVQLEEPEVEEEEPAEPEYLDFTQEMVSDLVEGEITLEEENGDDDDDGLDFSAWIQSTDEAEQGYAGAGDLPQIEVSECSKCRRAFDSVHGLKMHFPHCREEDAALFKHKCPICSIAFRYPALLKNHMNKHEGKTPYKCRKQCDRSFVGSVNRYIHEMQCAKEPQTCPICNCDLKSKRALNDHMIGTHGELKYACGDCGMKFRKTTLLTQHRIKTHRASVLKVQQQQVAALPPLKMAPPPISQPVVGEPPNPTPSPCLPFQCDECGKGFSHMPVMLYHKRKMHSLQSFVR